MINLKLPKKLKLKSQYNNKTQVQNNKIFKSFFYKIGLSDIYEESQKKILLTDKRISTYPHIPDLKDLYYLYNLIVLNNKISILEYGTGWSSLIIYKALLFNKNKNKKKYYTRADNPYSLDIIDNSKKFLKISKERLDKNFGKKNNIKFNYSPVKMTKFNDHFASHYTKHPVKNPDFIFLDAPNSFYVGGKVDNFTVNSFGMMPMACDILKFEFFLIPRTIIMSDGRAGNIQFLLKNFKRNWRHINLYNNSINILYLDEPSYGVFNDEQNKFHSQE